MDAKVVSLRPSQISAADVPSSVIEIADRLLQLSEEVRSGKIMPPVYGAFVWVDEDTYIRCASIGRSTKFQYASMLDIAHACAMRDILG